MTLLPFTLADCARAALLHQQAFERGWTENMFLGTPGTQGLKAEKKGQLVGFILWRTVVDETEILTFAVAPEYQRQGIGSALLQGITGPGRLYLEVAEDNSAALAFYQTHGFEILGKRPHYYERENGKSVSAFNLAKDLL